jgi:16S rRNA G527 N7-methylase RsmG
MTLMDSSRKKTVFLEGVRERFRLENLRIRHARVEELSKTGRPTSPDFGADVFDRITMRAVAPLHRSIPWIKGISRPGSRFFTYKGPKWREEYVTAERVGILRDWSLIEVREIPWAESRIMLMERTD